jgi:hypothetical protein
MQAQTLVYTLFAQALIGKDAPRPPLLPCRQGKEEQIIDENGVLAPLLSECRHLLEQTDLGAVLAGFGSETHRHNAVMHFYETFLASYSPAQRASRGVYSTPEPVVSYMVRSVDDLLRQLFAYPRGLADERVLIFDPATGTATFPYAIVQHIYAALRAEGQQAQWDTYLRTNLLPRLYGFEVMMAPYTIAHLNLALLLARLGHPLASSEQPHIYMANALAQPPALPAPADYPVLVAIGNPPYSNYTHHLPATLDKDTWIDTELRDYKQGLNERKLNLDDTFIKFMRAGQVWVERQGAGILAFITNNTYLDGITHRRMRQSLMASFTDIYLLDLHGHARKQERCPDGGRDENVFDIQQGVAIGIFARRPCAAGTAGTAGAPRLRHAEVWGERAAKYAFLARSSVATTPWDTLAPSPPFFVFAPRRSGADGASEEEYISWWPLPSIFPLQQNSIKTDRDRLFVDMEHATLEERICCFYSDEGLRSPFRETYRVENSSSYHLLPRRLKTSYNPANIRPCHYRPFDVRWLYYAPGLTSRPAWEVMRHMLAGPNLALAGMRQYDYQVPSYCYVLAVEHIIESRLFLSNRGAASIFPLYLYTNAPDGRARQPNLAPSFVSAVEQRLGLRLTPDGRGDQAETFGPDDLFHYIYALLHSPTYRCRYADLLKRDYPRVPLPASRALFAALAARGGMLVDLHLLRLPGSVGSVGGLGGADVLADPAHQGVAFFSSSTTSNKAENGVPVGSAAYQPGRVLLGRGWEVWGVPPEAWGLHIGGYRPLAKWLKDRRGQVLNTAAQQHYTRMVVALRETCALAGEIDTLLAGAMGWEQGVV